MSKPQVAIIDNELIETLIAKIQTLDAYVRELKADVDTKSKPYLSSQDLMELTGFGKTWINDNKQFIGYSTVGGCLRFKRSDVEEFMSENYFRVSKSK